MVSIVEYFGNINNVNAHDNNNVRTVLIDKENCLYDICIQHGDDLDSGCVQFCDNGYHGSSPVLAGVII